MDLFELCSSLIIQVRHGAFVMIPTFFRPGHRLKMIGSMSITYLSAAIYFSLMLYFGGFWTLCKYWLLPWLAYHAWMSVFITTAYHCKEVGDKKQRTIVVYCRYPRW